MQENRKKGPVAPKDPQKQRNFFYAACDTVIYGRDHGDGTISDMVFLGNGLLAKRAASMGGIKDEEMLGLLGSRDGFHKLIHSFGITIASEELDEVLVEFRMLGNKSRFGGETVFQASCSCDGAEQIFSVKDFQAAAEDSVPGIFAFKFKEADKTARVSIRYYLNDGYASPNLSMDPPVDFNSDAYKGMIEKSLLHTGNIKRIKEVIHRAQNGEEVTIAYIGGSVTGGAGAKPNTESYAYKSFTAFQKLCGENSKVNYIKAGVGGTPSEFGMIRYERDILKENTVFPDAVIVEFAVNDADDETKGNCYESLVYRILSAPNHPAVILLFAVFESDWNLQDRLSPVGYRYDLPMVSVKDAVVEQFTLPKENGNVITKRQFFFDIFHPTNDGHTVMADCLTNFFKKAMSAEPVHTDINLQQLPAIGRDFAEIRLADRSHLFKDLIIGEGSFTGLDHDLQTADFDAETIFRPIFPNNWMHSAENGNEPMNLRVKCRAFALVYKDTGSEEFGKAFVSVDGTEKILDPHLIGWTHCHPVILINEKETEWHEIKIRMDNKEEMKRFTVLGFGIVF